MLTTEERDIIRLLAGGDRTLKDQAVQIYRRYLKEDRNDSKDDRPFIYFMSEVDNVVPDLALRATYRHQVLMMK